MDKAVLAVVFESGKDEAADRLSRAAARLAAPASEAAGTSAEKARQEKLKVFEVMYNPNSIKLSIEGGRVQYENMQNPGNAESNLQSVQSEDTSLSFELLFDGEETRKTVNALMGMLSSERNRQVLFAWGSMSFPGEVVSLSSGFSLFDLTGKPVRGKVNMTIRQNGRSREQKQYWSDAYDNLW